MNNISLEEGLIKNGFIIYGFKGTSMNPLLKSGRDKAYIENLKKPLKKGDIALYLRDSGEYVLHRVMKAKNGVYTFCGDNHFVLEPNILTNQILGVCTGYFKGDKFIEFKKSFKYKIYLIFWGKCLFARRILNLFRRLFNKIKKTESN